ncbi:hypothetical protein BGZ61DRAFT_230914 [Ilyonectria robusta]|uniref:uncharacterized protein n=1 Tax=Ilyonectria robusta TaxID=1079257 RepID=UPI001E8CB46B|nr:uncharacterized protein BGZ61DRAFT_230914 [Ilyonectria robusta]KAH8651700.1 hypothetical protein BGZ61DRAFT_230914 [Ilyonectria robusta]
MLFTPYSFEPVNAIRQPKAHPSCLGSWGKILAGEISLEGGLLWGLEKSQLGKFRWRGLLEGIEKSSSGKFRWRCLLEDLEKSQLGTHCVRFWPPSNRLAHTSPGFSASQSIRTATFPVPVLHFPCTGTVCPGTVSTGPTAPTYQSNLRTRGSGTDLIRLVEETVYPDRPWQTLAGSAVRCSL